MSLMLQDQQHERTDRSEHCITNNNNSNNNNNGCKSEYLALSFAGADFSQNVPSLPDNLAVLPQEDMTIVLWNFVVMDHRRLRLVITASSREIGCLLYTSPSPRDRQKSRMPSSA